MNKHSAIALAKKVLQEKKKQYAFNANLYKKGIVKSFRTEADYKEYKKLEDAIETLISI